MEDQLNFKILGRYTELEIQTAYILQSVYNMFSRQIERLLDHLSLGQTPNGSDLEESSITNPTWQWVNDMSFLLISYIKKKIMACLEDKGKMGWWDNWSPRRLLSTRF